MTGWRQVALILFMLGLAQLAADVVFAQQLDPINNVADYLANVLTGKLAVAVGVIAVAGVGIAWLFGRIEWLTALGTVVGIAIIFGAARIVDILKGVVGT